MIKLAPYHAELQGLVVESTYNWYWLVDGLMEASYRVHLANPAAIQQYSGLKYTNDHSDARWLAHLLHLGVLPEGYIYPKTERAVRDLLRNVPTWSVSTPPTSLACKTFWHGIRGHASAANGCTS